MNNESVTLNIIDGIYDIQPLANPAISSLELTLIILFSLLAISSLLYYFWLLFYSCKGVAKRKIKKLYSEYLQNKTNEHDTVFQLCSFLRKGLKINTIGKNSYLPARLKSYKSEWEIFTKNLSNLRYANNEISHADINTLFKDSLHWLKLWP